MFVAAVAVCATFVAAAPAATAADQSGVVASERSFPKTSVARKDVLKESVSTDVKGNWGGIESLNVPKTKSQAEKDAEQERQEAAARAQQEAAAQQAAAASRSATRSSLESSSSASLTVNPPDSKTAAALVSYAEQFVGQVPYVWGGSTTSGWDCSGFVMYVFAQFGISLPHGASDQYASCTPVSDAERQPGDLVFFSTYTSGISHVGIYIGGGLFIHASSSYGVTISSLGNSYYASCYLFSGRLIND